jgi:farnesyl-diphosphate farnesyltransferase
MSEQAHSPPMKKLDLHQLLKGVSRSFNLSIRLLPKVIQAPVAIGYLLARTTDTVADTTAQTQTDRLNLLAGLIRAIEAPSDVIEDLTPQIQAFARQQDNLQERALMHAWPECLAQLQGLTAADQRSVREVLGFITQGQMADVAVFGDGPNAFNAESDLDNYTWQVAGCVGEFWTEVCARHLPDFSSRPTLEMRQLGRRYGMGLQRLNILRDSGADLAGGRCYWPRERLSDQGLDPAQLFQSVLRGQPLIALTPLWEAYLDSTQAQLEDGLHYCLAVNNIRVRLASALPALIGIRTLALLRQSGPGALTQPVKMPRHEVRKLMWRILLGGATRNTLAYEFKRLSAVRESNP